MRQDPCDRGRRGKKHAFTIHRLGGGMRRMECYRCGDVIIELDAAEEGGLVSVPALFRPSPRTLFSVLADEEREQESDSGADDDGVGPRFAFSPAGSPIPR